MLGATSAMVVFGVLLGAFVYVLSGRLAHASLAESVETRAHEVRAQVADLAVVDADAIAAGVDSPVLVEVVDADGLVLARSPGLHGATDLCAGPGGYIVVVRTAQTRSGDLTVCAATSLAPVERVESSVLVALALLLPLVVIGVGVTVWFAVGRALTSVEGMRRQAETMTRTARGSLVVQRTGDEVERLGHTLNDLIDDLRAQTRVTRQFVADAGHELRNPLTTLRVALEFDDGRFDGRELALAEVARLEELVADLLVLARSDAGEEPVRARVDLAGLVRGSIAARAGVRPEVGFRLDLPTTTVVVDARSVRGAVDNLIANAVRHAASTVAVEIGPEPGERDEDLVVLRVDDDGSGLAARDCERVFDRFVRLDESRDRDDGGSGLGLAIVAAVALAHDGRAWAEPGPGGHFRLALPAGPPGT